MNLDLNRILQFSVITTLLLFNQVFEFVRLTELYYAGSHGMDIMGPVRPSSTDDHPNSIRSTDKQVSDSFDLASAHHLVALLIFCIEWPVHFWFSISFPAVDKKTAVLILSFCDI